MVALEPLANLPRRAQMTDVRVGAHLYAKGGTHPYAKGGTRPHAEGET